MSRPRAIAGLIGLPVYIGLVYALSALSLAWAVFCDVLPAGFEEIKREWRE